MRLALTITAEAPLAFPASKPGTQFRESLPYVPGAVIFGALAGLLAEAGHSGGPLWAQLRRARCWNAYPARHGDLWSRPLPATLLTSKDDQLQPDTLVPLVCWEQLEPAALIFETADLAAAGVCYTLREGPEGRTRLVRRSVSQRVLTRVAINRRRGTAEDARLYSPLVLSEYSGGAPTRFQGAVELPDGAEELAGWLARITHLGGRQSSGLGAVAVAAGPAPPEPLPLAERVAELTRRFQAQAALYAALAPRRAWPIAPSSLFTVNLLADAILHEAGWLPTTTLSPGLLYEATGVRARLVRAFAAPRPLSGWQVLWQRPKASALGVAAGAVFLFQAEAPLGEDELAALARLERAGLGERVQEGLGQVRICDDVHVTDWEEAMREEP